MVIGEGYGVIGSRSGSLRVHNDLVGCVFIHLGAHYCMDINSWY